MGWVHELKFQPSGNIEEVIAHKGHSYVLPDGRRAAMIQCYIWCFGCNGFSWAEELPSIEEVEKIIRTWDGPNSGAPGTEHDAAKSPDEVIRY